MFKVRVIPCLDVKDGRVVKGVNFVNLRDAGDPVEAAIAYDAAGADELCFLDITASNEMRETIYEVVTRTAEACFMPLTVGGGVRTVDGLLTGFHEPRASHLAMLTAFAGLGHLERAYGAALDAGYLWHEFGDLHLIL